MLTQTRTGTASPPSFLGTEQSSAIAARTDTPYSTTSPLQIKVCPVPRFLVSCYIVFTVTLSLFLVIVRPPLSVPDEGAHVARAVDIASGLLLGPASAANGQLVGSADSGLLTIYVDMHEKRYTPFTPTTAQHYSSLTWTANTLPFRHNALLYAPVNYMPQVLGLGASWAMGLKVWQSLNLGSLVNATVAIVVSASAISLAPYGAAFLFIVLSLPMTIFMFASFSPDAMTISSAALLAVIAARVLEAQKVGWAAAVGLALLGISFASTRIVYLPVLCAVFLVLFACTPAARTRISGAAIVALGVPLLWHWISGAGSASYAETGTVSDQRAALQFLLSHPSAVLTIASSTLKAFGKYYIVGMLGTLGWMDANIPRWVAWPLFLALVATLILSVPRARGAAAPLWAKFAILVGIGLSVGVTFLALYLIYNPVGSTNPILGIQGRYFLPLLPFLLLVLPKVREMHGLPHTAACVALGAGFVSAAGLISVILARYYLPI